MNNPLKILQALDKELTAPAELTLFGRAAMALGYPGAPAAMGATSDVDAILPLAWLEAGDAHLDFWQAQQRANTQLAPEGLYFTHLFRESEVILTPDWLKHRVRMPADLPRLTLFRPSNLDLILTKMARGDENDLADIRFLLQREALTEERLRAGFERARVPDVPEIRELFRIAQPKVLSMLDSK
jgi:hypothetical protein